MADTDASSETPICAKCDEPCAPKLKGSGLCIYCRSCRDKANEKVQRARARQAQKKRKRELTHLIATSLAPTQEKLDRLLGAVAKLLPPVPPP
jgi:hypothetical protein